MADGVQISGLKKLTRELTRAGVEVSDLKDVMFGAGELVAREAQALAPHRSGALAASIRPSKAKNKAIIRAGGARVRYAAVQNYGGYHNITGQHFLQRAVASKQSAAVAAVGAGLAALIRRVGL